MEARDRAATGRPLSLCGCGHAPSHLARFLVMLMFHSSTEGNEMLTTWNFPQNKRFLFRLALTSSRTCMCLCRIISCYVMTPGFVPTSTVRYGGNPALKNPVLEPSPESYGAWKAGRWHKPFPREQPGAVCVFCATRWWEASLQRKEPEEPERVAPHSAVFSLQSTV